VVQRNRAAPAVRHPFPQIAARRSPQVKPGMRGHFGPRRLLRAFYVSMVASLAMSASVIEETPAFA
jgi:hypothetical protein